MSKNVKVIFNPSRKGGVITKIRGRIAFPDRRWQPVPQAGDEWEVEIAGENPAKTVYFLLPVRLVSTQAERERWNAAIEATKDCGYHQLGLSHDDVAKVWLKGGEEAVKSLISSRIDEIRNEVDRIFGQGEFENAAMHKTTVAEWKILQNCRFVIEIKTAVLEQIKSEIHDISFLDAVEVAYRMMCMGLGPQETFETIKREKEAQLSSQAAYEAAVRRARELTARVHPKEEEQETIYVSEYTTKEIVDFRDVHSCEKVRKVYVFPVKPPLELESPYPYESDFDLLKRLVPYLKNMTVEELDELVQGGDELAVAVDALYRAIHPWRWKRVRICLTDEVKSHVLEKYPNAIFKDAVEYVRRK